MRVCGEEVRQALRLETRADRLSARLSSSGGLNGTYYEDVPDE
jgi:hypothetical protein